MKRTMETRSWGGWTRRAMKIGALSAGIALLPLMTTRIAGQDTAPTYSAVYAFTGGTDGGSPDTSLIHDAAGNLYGTTEYYGAYGAGVVFKVDPAGNESVLYAFTGGADGGYPVASLVLDPAGNLFGTTEGGGNPGCPGPFGCGVVFKLDPAGTETVLYAFTGGSDGEEPSSGLIRDSAGNLYGTAAGGNPSCPGGFGCGVVFKLDPDGVETVLHSFAGGPSDGQLPSGGLIRDSVGNLYGTTVEGGSGYGIVFKLDSAGDETVLHAFAGEPDGSEPYSPLVLDAAGNLYGTTLRGGTTGGSSCLYGCGVVFRVDPAGNETVLHRFVAKDGAYPNGLIRDANGNLYVTTQSLGPAGDGSVFKLSPAGREIIVYDFFGSLGLFGGTDPFAGLLAYQGHLYGTTLSGGDFSGNQSCSEYGCGVVFKITLH